MKIYLTLFIVIAILNLSACESAEHSKQPIQPRSENPDIVVIGSELEGLYLARAATDEGLTVTILDPREKMGGQLIQGEMLFLDEPTDDRGNTLLQGRVKELFDQFKKGDIRKTSEFITYYQELIKGIPIESGVEVLSIGKNAESKNNMQRINSITYKTATGQVKTTTAKYWVENTDFAALSGKLSNKRIPGIETVFGGQKDYMAATYIMKFDHVDWEMFKDGVSNMDKKSRTEKYGSETTVTDTFTWGFGNVGRSYKPSNEGLFLRGLNALNQRDGEVLLNALLVFDVHPNDPQSITDALTNGRNETELVLEHLRKELPGWEDAQISNPTEYLYIRDTDRYETEYVLQATDVLGGTMHWDNISIAGYSIDLQGTRNSPWGTSTGKPDKYGMPLRSFLLKDYKNVIVAGKNVGASAVAYGSARIQPNTSLAGEVIGIVLGQLGGKPLVDINKKEMKKIQKYISKEYDIQLTGIKSNNKVDHLTQEQKKQVDIGKLVVPK